MTAPARAAWHLIAPEYPPDVGGVADYTRLVAGGLAAAGDRVEVWAPPAGSARPSGGEPPEPPGVTVHRLSRGFGPRGLGRLASGLDAHPAPRRLLVQWVPHGYGLRALNMPFCAWLRRRAALAGDRVELMVHEPFLSFGEGGLRQDAAAAFQRWMTVVLLRSTQRVWVSIPAWAEMLAPYAPDGLAIDWLPLPSTVPPVATGGGRAPIGAGLSVVGHLGTYGPPVTELLEAAVTALLRRGTGTVVRLLGAGGERFRARLVARDPALAGRLEAPGTLAPTALSAAITGCDLMLQPFPDGVSSRRTSAMAALAHGVALATTVGRLSEPLWEETGAVALAPVDDPGALVATTARLLEDRAERCRLAAAGEALYRRCFALEHTLESLRSGSAAHPGGAPARLP